MNPGCFSALLPCSLERNCCIALHSSCPVFVVFPLSDFDWCYLSFIVTTVTENRRSEDLLKSIIIILAKLTRAILAAALFVPAPLVESYTASMENFCIFGLKNPITSDLGWIYTLIPEWNDVELFWTIKVVEWSQYHVCILRTWY